MLCPEGVPSTISLSLGVVLYAFSVVNRTWPLLPYIHYTHKNKTINLGSLYNWFAAVFITTIKLKIVFVSFSSF